MMNANTEEPYRAIETNWTQSEHLYDFQFQ